MKRREIILLVATLIIIGLGVYLYMSPEEEQKDAGAAATVAVGDLMSVKKTFSDNLKMLKKGKSIDDRFERLSAGLEENRVAGVDPGITAQNQLYMVLTEQLGIPTPSIQNAKPEPIKNVDDHYFINIPFKVNGTEAEMKKLLYDIERLGFLIQTFRLSQLNHGEGMMDLDVTVSKLVKHDKDSRHRMGLDKNSKWTRGS